RNPFPSLSSQFSEGRLNGRPNYFEPNFVRTIFIADRFKPNSVVTRASRGLHSQSSVGNRRSQISLPWSPCLRLLWPSGVTGSPPAPCPLCRAAPSQQRSLRSEYSGPRDAGSRGRWFLLPSRRRLPSQAERT